MAAGGRAGRGGAGIGGDISRQVRDARFRLLQFAVYDEAYWLSGDDRRRLRATGELPDGFVERVRPGDCEGTRTKLA